MLGGAPHWILDTVSPEPGISLPWFILKRVVSSPHHFLGFSAATLLLGKRKMSPNPVRFPGWLEPGAIRQLALIETPGFCLEDSQ